MKKFLSIIAGVLVCLLMLVGCNKRASKADVGEIIESSENSNKENTNPEEFTLKALIVDFDESYIKQIFNELYPKAKIEVTKYNSYETDKIKEAIESANDPDVIIYYSQKVGIFNYTDAFEDLSQPQYNFDELKATFTERELSQCVYYDGKKLIALPTAIGAKVTYYRADIMEQHGLPSDPEQLAKLMETTEGFLSIANTLNKDNIKIIGWKDDIVKMVLDEYGLYDKDMNLNISNPKLKDAIKLYKFIYENDLSSEKNVWGDDGKKAIKEGKLAMIYMNRWGEDFIKGYAPELVGKLRTTRLPLALNNESGSKNVSIFAKSQHKMEAWNFAKTIVMNDRNYYNSISNKASEFLGGQLANKLYNDLATGLPRIYPTLLDEKAYNIIIQEINTYAGNAVNIDEFLTSIKTKIDAETLKERDILTEYIKGNS